MPTRMRLRGRNIDRPYLRDGEGNRGADIALGLGSRLGTRILL